ncbi:hypothetical protein M2396_004062 [Pseudomonas sp. BIGb0278]|uniref:hypothetical protein n=1 Tax=Pseudomonas sp. BIGb0278 TaxID=2940607 RepID=UPI002166C599|nr:hypothetical protein [Pseudomonas sp. BIGb0278]MCS4285758.1 hypothetical protein [Pseudomonas sp. BIGb0278]MEE4652430.1 hypothetical protein [Pseudomonas alliivorans]
MSAAIGRNAKSYYIPQSLEYAHRAVAQMAATTEDGCDVVMCLGDSRYPLSARQADAIAQGLLMAVMRTGLCIARMPWDGGGLMKVERYNGERSALRFADDTIHGEGASFRFFGVCWTYEGEGEDPSYPANALCIRTMHDGGVLFGKGDRDYLLTAEQAFRLCQDLTGCAYSLKSRSWSIWDVLIEWVARGDDEAVLQTAKEKELFEHLKNFALSSISSRKTRKH